MDEHELPHLRQHEKESFRDAPRSPFTAQEREALAAYAA